MVQSYNVRLQLNLDTSDNVMPKLVSGNYWSNVSVLSSDFTKLFFHIKIVISHAQ